MGEQGGGRSRRGLRLLAAVALVTAVVVVAGVLAVRSGGGAGTAGSEASPEAATPTSVADVETTTLGLSRSAFCDDVSPETVVDVLGSAPTQAEAYDDGDRVRLVRGTQDVSHEYGCLWKSGKTIARGWVFAPPVTPQRARQLARETRRTAAEQDCERLRDAPPYGDPSVVLLCPTTRGSEVSYRGLYGDAWLTCTLSAPRSAQTETLLAGADRLCAAVLEAAAGG